MTEALILISAAILIGGLYICWMARTASRHESPRDYEREMRPEYGEGREVCP